MKKLLLFCLLSVLMSMTYIANAQSPGSGCCFWLEDISTSNPAEKYNLNLPYNSQNYSYYYFKFNNTCLLSDTSKISIDWEFYKDGVLIDQFLNQSLDIQIETKVDNFWVPSNQLKSGRGSSSSQSCPNNIDYPGGLGGPYPNQYCNNGAGYLTIGENNNLYNFFYVHFLQYASDNNLIRVKIKRISNGDFSLKFKLIRRYQGSQYGNFYNAAQNLYIGGKESLKGPQIGTFTLEGQTYSTATANACSGDTIKVGINPQGQPYSYVMFPTIPDPVAQMVVNVPFYNKNWNCADYIDSMVTYTMTWAPVPGAPNVNNYSRCGAGTLTFTGSHPLQAQYPSLTYRWYSSSTLTPANLLYTGNVYTTPSLPEDTHLELWVTASISGCEGLPQHVDGYVFKQPGLTLTNPTDLCPVAGTKMVTASVSNIYMTGSSCDISMVWNNATSNTVDCTTLTALVPVTNACNASYPYSATLTDNTTGCSVTANNSFTLVDIVAPDFTVPGEYTAYKGAGCSLDITPAITGTVSNITDNCSDPNFTTTFNDVVTAGSCTDNYTITRTWTVADHCGNATTHNQTINVRDIIAPTFTVPANITVYTDGACNYNVLPAVTGNPSNVADNCTTSPAVTYEDNNVAGSCQGSRVITRTWTVTDNCGNFSTATQVITVSDNTPPTFTVPPTATVYKDAECNHNIDPSVTGVPTLISDNCSTSAVVTHTDETVAGNCTGAFVVTRTWRVTDNCGNYSTATQTINILDNIAPTFTVPADITIYTNTNCQYDASIAQTGDVVNEHDNCSQNIQATFTDAIADGTCAGEKVITRTWTLVDDCSNTTTKTQIITVEDNIAPTFEVPANITIYTDATCAYNALPSVTGNPTSVRDNCTSAPVVTYNDENIAGPCQGSRIITRLWTVTDACGNFSTNTQIITVSDNIAPTFTVPADITIFKDATCDYDASVSITGDVTDEADNCSTNIQATYNDVVTPGSCTGAEIITRTWTLVDHCGNETSKVQVITALDKIAPTFTVPAAITIYKNGTCGYDASVGITGDVTNEADNCSTGLQAVFTDAVVPGSCTGAEIITRTWTLTDACGNETVQTQIITVLDNTAPTFTQPADITIYKNSTCGYDASVAVTGDVTNEADNCSTGLNATFTDAVVAGNCTGAEIITRTWSVTDACGNTTTHTQTITVLDNTVPTFTVPADITINRDAVCGFDASIAVTGDVTDEADNCSTGLQATYESVYTAGSCPVSNAYITRTWTLVDACNNTTTHVQIITITDVTKPTFTVPADIAICKDNNNVYNADTVYTGRVLILADNCTATQNLVINFTDQTNAGTATTVGTILRTWTVTDACSNTQTATQTITLNPAPVASIAVSPTPSFCLPVSGGTNVTATLSALPAVDYTYYIIRPALDTVLSNTASQNISAAGTVTFSGYVIDNATGCRSALVSASTEALLYPDFTVTVIQNKRGCRDDVPSLNGSLSVTHFNDYSFTISPNVGSYAAGVFSNLPINNYSITAEHLNGCVYTKQQAIIFDTIYTPVAKFELGGRDADTAVCWTSGMFLSTLVTDLNNIPAHQYNFHIIVPTNITTDGSNGIRIYAPGIYAIGGVIENVTTGCRDTAWHYVYAMAYPTVDVTSTPFCLNTNVALSMTATPALSTPHNYTYQWTSVNTLDTVLGIATTLSHFTTVSNKYYGAATANYSYTGLNAYGATLTFSLACTSRDSVTVTPLPLPEFTAEQYSPKRVCNARDTGSISIVDGWNPAFTWTLTRVATGATSTITNSTFQVPDSGYYNISVTNLNGCTYTLNNIFVNEVRVGFNAVLHADVDSLISGVDNYDDLTFCWNHGSQRIFHEIRYTNNPIFSYQYTILTPTEIAQISSQSSYVTAAGTYILSGYVTNLTTGCVSNIDSLTVYAVPTPQYTISDDATICRGDSIKVGIDPTTVFTTTWTYGPTVADSLMINPTVYGAGTTFKAYVKVSSSLPGAAFSCSVNDSVTISINNQPVISKPVVTDVTCNGLSNGAISIDVTGTSPYTYLWSNGATTEDLTNVPAGTYSVTVTDAIGCISIEENIVVSQPADITLNTPTHPAITCYGGTITVTMTATGGTGTLTYTFNGVSNTTGTFTGIGAGTYNYSVTDANSCGPKTGSITIGQPTDITLNTPTHPAITCYGGTTTVTMTATGGTGTLTYTFNGVSNTTGTFTGIGAGTYNYSVTDANSCGPKTGSITIGQPTDITLNTPTHPAITCYGGTITVTMTATGGTGTLTYTFNGVSNTTGTFTGIGAGTYNYSVTDANSCGPKTGSITIGQPTDITLNTPTHPAITCYGGTTTVTMTATGGTGTLTYTFNGVSNTTGTFTGIGAGTYNYSVTDANSCGPKTGSITIGQPTDITLNTPTHPAITCYGGTTTVTMTATGGTGTLTYTLNGVSNTTGTFTGIGAGTYNYSVTDANSCGPKTGSITIGQPTDITLNTPTHPAITCYGGTITVTMTATGGTGTLTYTFNGVSNTTGTFTGIGAGTYNYSVTDANSCGPKTGSITIGQPTDITLNTPTHPAITCYGGTTTVTMTATGGTGTLTYTFNGVSNTTGTFTGIGAGTYNYSVTDANSCGPKTGSITIGQPTDITLNTPTHPAITCYGGTITVTMTATGGTGTLTYTFNGVSNTTGTFTGIGAGTYNYSVIDANSCGPKTGSITIGQPTDITLNTPTHPAITCYGGTTTVTMTATGGTGTLTYTFNGVSNTTGTFTGIGAGTYNYSVTDANSCGPKTGSITIGQPTDITLNTPTHPAITCYGGTITVTMTATGGTGTLTYTFNGVSNTTGTFTGIGAGTYNYSVTDANSCGPKTGSITIGQPTDITLNTPTHPAITCYGGTTTVTMTATGGTGTLTYTFNGVSNTTGTFTGIGAGTYNYSVTDANSCGPKTGSITIGQPTDITLNTPTHPAITCYGGTITVTMTATGGTGTLTYTFNGVSNTTGTFTGIGAGTYNYSVTDANSCGPKTGSITIGQPTDITLNTPTHPAITCYGGTTTVTMTATGGTGTLTYTFNGVSNTTGTFTGIGAGTYNYSVTDANSCGPKTGSITIGQPTDITLNTPTHPAITCYGGTTTVTMTATGGTGTLTYTFNGVSNTTGTFTGIGAGTYNYSVTDANSCGPKTGSITITQPDALAITIDSTRNVSCNGGNNGAIYITVTGGVTPYVYEWSNVATSHDITGISADEYFVVVTDANNCTATSTTVTITQPLALSATTSSTNVKCYNGNDGSATVDNVTGGTAPYTYLWPQGGTDSDTLGLRTGSYTVTITDANLCAITRTFNITQPTAISTSISTTSPICTGTTTLINLSVSNGTPGSPIDYTYLWNSSETTQDITKEAGTYTVTVTDGNLCTTTATTTITNYTVPTITTNEPPQVCLSTAFYVTAIANQTGNWTAQVYKSSTNAPIGSPYSSTLSDSLHVDYTSPATSDTIYIVYTFTSNIGGCVYTDTTNDIKMSGEPRLRIYRNSSEDNYATINQGQQVSYKFMVDNTCNTPAGTRLAITYSIYRQDSINGAKVPVTNLTDYTSNANSFVTQMDLAGTGLDAYYPSSFNYSSTLSQAPAAHFPLATSSGAVLGSDQFDFFSLAYFQNRQGKITVTNFTEPGIYTIEYALITNYSNPAMTTPHGNQIYVMTTLTPSPLGGNQFFTGTYYTKVWSTNSMTITVNDVPGSPVIPGDDIAHKPMKLQPEMKIYPNPSSPGQLVYIEVENISGDATIAVSAINGSVLQKTAVTIADTQKHVIYNLTDLVPGIYFVTLTSKDAVITKKVVISPR